MFIQVVLKRIGALSIKVVLECEHCRNSWESQVEDSEKYTNGILPNVHCTKCNKTGLDKPSKKPTHAVSSNNSGVIALGLKHSRKVIQSKLKSTVVGSNFEESFQKLFNQEYGG